MKNSRENSDPSTAVVTGANSGIGFEISKTLFERGFEVWMLCRNRQRAKEAAESIASGTEPERLRLLIADLGIQSEVRRAAETFRTQRNRLDLLVNNAGIIPGSQREETAEGIEKTLAVNHLAPFLLTSELFEPLKSAGSARVVNVASEAHRAGEFDPGNLQLKTGYNSTRAYANTKMFNIMFSFELHRRMSEQGITVYAVHPGTVRTRIDAGGSSGSLFLLLYKLGKPFMRSPKKGAETPLWLALEPGIESMSGRYFQDKRVKEPLEIAHNPQACRKLWELSEELTRNG